MAATETGTVRIGVVGVGRIGRMHASLLMHQVPGASVSMNLTFAAIVLPVCPRANPSSDAPSSCSAARRLMVITGTLGGSVGSPLS